MNRRQLIRSFALLTLGEQLGLLRSALAAGNKPVPPGMHRITGEVAINGKPAKAGMAVQAGDTVTTGSGSEAVYVVGRDAYLQRDRSSVEFLGDSLVTGLRVASGKLLSVFGKGEKRIDTPTATIGIRGTGCYIEADPALVYFCLCYGAADITPLADPGQRELIQTKHHDHPLIIAAAGTQMMAPANVRNHSDEELTLIESLVGRYPPFYGQSYSSY